VLKVELVEVTEIDKFHIRAFVWGPRGTCFEGGLFHLDMIANFVVGTRMIQNLRCLTKIWHPNIHQETGEVCDEFLCPADYMQGINIRTSLLQF